ncbi:MAG: ATP-binding cassette domain-containing protein [Synergistaceae bacterium]|jgi:peptide/nickel transport system ATP-binding protein|nr:ATP-binding cassette domain-containing protein [Synergistaceae bacterium]
MEKESGKLLEVKNLKKYFRTKSGPLCAVDDVSFNIYKGRTLGLVGESGCGKSTAGRTILRLHEPTAGDVYFEGENVVAFSKSKMKNMRKQMQIVFQDPYSSLNPRMDVKSLIEDSLKVSGGGESKKEREEKVRETMSVVGLEQRLVSSYPHELDGGRRQRIGIARALILNPKFIVMDEPVSALDVCVQAQILNLLARLQEQFGLTYLFISHNLSVVKHVSDRVAVMYLGKIVEIASYRDIFKKPLHPYTQALLSAILLPKIHVRQERIILEGDITSPVNPPPGCRFESRCRMARPLCREQCPELRNIGDTVVACHFAG